MKYLLLMNYTPASDLPPVSQWSPEDIRASGAAMGAIHEELRARGELIDAQGLTGPEAARIVSHDGVGAPVITDGPFPESKEFLAGYWFIDVESEQRAIEIAARTSAAPGPGGRPTGRQIQLRPVMERAPDPEL